MQVSDLQDDRQEAVDVLLVEDNPGDVRLTEEALEDGGVDTNLYVASDGVEGLDFLRQRGEYAEVPEPAIVLLDLNLPRKNGDEVLETIKDDEDLCHIPVVVLTSSRSHEDVRKAYQLRANAYMTKPVDPSEFIETLSNFEELWFSLLQLPGRDR